jgi:ribosomal protein L19E
MQQFCKHDTAATNRGTIQDGVRYSVDREGIKRKPQTSSVHASSRQGVQGSDDRSEDPSARKGSTENRNQKTEFLVYVL